MSGGEVGGGMLWVERELVEFCLQGRILDRQQFTQYNCRMTIDYCFRGFSVIIVAAVTQMALNDTQVCVLTASVASRMN